MIVAKSPFSGIVFEIKVCLVYILLYRWYAMKYLTFLSDQNNPNMTDEEIKTHLKRWKRYAEAQRLEKEWMNERLSWLFTPQTILFAALAFIYGKDTLSTSVTDALRTVIPLAGLTISVIVMIGVGAAGVMHWQWTSKLKEIANLINKDAPEYEVPFGSPPYAPARISSIVPVALSLVFIVAWAYVLWMPCACSDSCCR
jgi:hypothetical protein